MIAQGSICWFEPGRSAARRPVVVLQSDAFTRSAIPTVVVAPLAQDQRLLEAPGNVLIPSGISGLPQDTVLVVTEIVALPRNQISEGTRRLSKPLLGRVQQGIRLVLGLDGRLDGWTVGRTETSRGWGKDPNPLLPS